MVKFSALVASAIVVVFAGAAQAETYICKVKPIGRDMGWIGKTVAININEDTNTVLVSDDSILYYYKKPIAGRLATSNGKRVTVTWEIEGAKSRTNQYVPRFLYRATYIKPSGKFTISANPPRYANTFRGRGTCEVRK